MSETSLIILWTQIFFPSYHRLMLRFVSVNDIFLPIFFFFTSLFFISISIILCPSLFFSPAFFHSSCICHIVHCRLALHRDVMTVNFFFVHFGTVSCILDSCSESRILNSLYDG